MFPVLKQDDVTYVVCIMGICNPSSSVAELQTNLVRSSLKTDKQQSHLENNVEYLRILAFCGNWILFFMSFLPHVVLLLIKRVMY